MKPKFTLFVLVAALAAVLLSGCASGASLSNSWPGLASDGETAYLASGQYVYAIRLSDGKEIWRYPAKGSNSIQFIAQPVVAPDGTVVIGSAGSDHRLVAIDPSNIDASTNSPIEKWIFSEAKSSWVAGALILNNKVFAPNSDGTLYVLDLQDGSSTKSALKEVELGGALWAQPSTDGKLVYVTSVDHHLYAINPETYDFAWPAIDLGGAVPGTPLVGPDGNVYIGSFASKVVKVDVATGKATPLISTPGWIWGGPVSDGQLIYFGDLDGNLFAVDAASGSQSWTIKPDGPIVGSPLVLAGNIVFATESGSVYAVDNTGKILWQHELGGQIYTTPVAGTDQIIVAPMKADFSLAMLDANGNQVWSFKPAN
jgi:eukaryotic-like serine/threonine-protein kinase